MSDTETTSSIINSFETLKYYVLYFQVCTRTGHYIVCTDFHTGWALYYIYRLALEVGIILYVHITIRAEHYIVCKDYH